MPREPGTEERALEALVGRWKTEGWTEETADAPAMRIDAVDTYEWLPGGFGLLHRVDARVGDERVEGGEIIGWDPDRGCYLTRYFGSDGPNAYEAALSEEDEGLVWTMRSGTDRFRGVFIDGGNGIEGHWEQLDGSEWRPWMDVTLTRERR